MSPELMESVRSFLYGEARLLDQCQLKEWTGLYAKHGRYLIPPLNTANAASISYESHLFLIADDYSMLCARAERLLKKSAHVENPRSHIRHFISNVSVVSQSPDEILVSSSFCVYRIRRGEIGLYVGEYLHRLAPIETSYQILEKRVCLDLDRLEPHGSIGIIL